MTIKRTSCVLISIVMLLSGLFCVPVYADVPNNADVKVIGHLVNIDTHEVITIDEDDVVKTVKTLPSTYSLMGSMSNNSQNNTSQTIEYSFALKFDPNNPTAAPMVFAEDKNDTKAKTDGSYSTRVTATANYSLATINNWVCVKLNSVSAKFERLDPTVQVTDKIIEFGQYGDIPTGGYFEKSYSYPVSGWSAAYTTNFSDYIIAWDSHACNCYAACTVSRGGSTWYLDVTASADID